MNFRKRSGRALGASRKHDWRTPPEVLARVRRVASIGLDPCAAADPAAHFARKNYFLAAGDDGLALPWETPAGLVFVNPPYGAAVPAWARKAREEAKLGAMVIFLVAARTDTKAWHESLFPKADAVAFWRRRIRFIDPATGGRRIGAPFPSALVLMGAPQRIVDRFTEAFRTAGSVLQACS